MLGNNHREIYDRTETHDLTSPKNEEVVHDKATAPKQERQQKHAADSETYRQKLETHRKTTREAAEESRQTKIQEVRQTIQKTTMVARPLNHLQSAENWALRAKNNLDFQLKGLREQVNGSNFGVNIGEDGTIEDKPGLKQKIIRFTQGKNPFWKTGLENLLRSRSKLEQQLQKIKEDLKHAAPAAEPAQKNDRPFVPVEHTVPERGSSSSEAIGPGQEIPFEEEAAIVEKERSEGLKQEFVYTQREIDDNKKKMEEFSNLEASDAKEEKIQRVKQKIKTLEEYKNDIGLDRKTAQSLAEKIHSTQSYIESFVPKFSGLSTKNQVESLQKIENDSGGVADLTPLLTKVSIEKVSDLREEEKQGLLLKVRKTQQDIIRRQAMRRELFQSGIQETNKDQQAKKILDKIFEQITNQKIEKILQYTERLKDAETSPLRPKEIEEFKKASLDDQISQIRKLKKTFPKRDFTPLLTSDVSIENKTNFGTKPILKQISILGGFIKEFPSRQRGLERLVQSINTEQLQENINNLSSEEFEIMENVCRRVQTPEAGRSPSETIKIKIDKVSSMVAKEENRRLQIAA